MNIRLIDGPLHGQTVDRPLGHTLLYPDGVEYRVNYSDPDLLTAHFVAPFDPEIGWTTSTNGGW